MICHTAGYIVSNIFMWIEVVLWCTVVWITEKSFSSVAEMTGSAQSISGSNSSVFQKEQGHTV